MEKASEAALHPDGKTLVFDRDGKIWAGPLRGGAPRELVLPPHGNVGSIAFAPDGSMIAVIAERTLWILPYPSGAPRNLGPVGSDLGVGFPTAVISSSTAATSITRCLLSIPLTEAAG
jgi:hypothetical protein